MRKHTVIPYELVLDICREAHVETIVVRSNLIAIGLGSRPQVRDVSHYSFCSSTNKKNPSSNSIKHIEDALVDSADEGRSRLR